MNRNGSEGKYLIFSMNGQEFGIGISQIREIIQYMEPTPVPSSPDFLRGLINLRGQVMPVFDLRVIFSAPSQQTERACIVIAEIRREGAHRPMGFIVDSVSEVIQVKEEEIEPPSSLGGYMNFSFMVGIAKSEEGTKILLDLANVLSLEKTMSPTETWMSHLGESLG